MRLITILCERVLLNRVNTIYFISTHLCISSTNPFETTLPPCSSLLSVNVALCWSYARTPYHFHQCAPLILNFLTKPSCHMTCRMQVPSHSYSLCKCWAAVSAMQYGSALCLSSSCLCSSCKASLHLHFSVRIHLFSNQSNQADQTLFCNFSVDFLGFQTSILKYIFSLV